MRARHPVGRLFRTPILGGLAERRGRPALGLILGYYDVVPGAVRRKWTADFDRDQRRALHRMYQANPVDVGTSLIPRLAELDRPALVVWGRRDRFVPIDQADQRLAFPHAQIEVLPSSGHYPHLDNPRRVEELVIPFLRQHLHQPQKMPSPGTPSSEEMTRPLRQTRPPSQ
jgi:pimeloyl-ACP methyl ester carboxylesterase